MNLKYLFAIWVFIIGLVCAPISQAHHSMLLYDKDRLVSLEGAVSYAKFGNPHSRFELTVTINGQKEVWAMIAQDPQDAKRFGYFDELKALKVGDRLKIVGWPHKRNKNEILGQNMIMASGKLVELIPITGYVRPQMYQIMDWAVIDPNVQSHVLPDDAKLTGAAQLLAWSQNDHPIARAATEVQKNRAKLIATTIMGEAEFHGMPKYLLCQADNGNSVTYQKIDFGAASDEALSRVEQWLQTYNRVLAKHWELERESCGQ